MAATGGLDHREYSFPAEERAEIFRFAIEEIRKRSDCTIALCKESAAVWEAVGLPLSRCACVCQLEAVDLLARRKGVV